jgi:hypothetical protein
MKAEMPGAIAPFGFIDPLGFAKKADAATLAKYRESELKHGRTAMLAVFGILTTEKWHPLYDGKLSSNPLQALADCPPLAFVQIIAFCGLLEYAFMEQSKLPGSNAGDVFGLNDRTEDPKWIDLQNRELSNGRLAMFAVLGELAHAGLTGKGPLEYWVSII